MGGFLLVLIPESHSSFWEKRLQSGLTIKEIGNTCPTGGVGALEVLVSILVH